MSERHADGFHSDRLPDFLNAKELRRLQLSLDRGRPYGDDEWTNRTASALCLGLTI